MSSALRSRDEVAFLNDIQGFPDPSLYPELAAASCRLVVMHAVHGRGRAQRLELLRRRGMGPHLCLFYRPRCGPRTGWYRAGAAYPRPRHGLFPEQPAGSIVTRSCRPRPAEAGFWPTGADLGVAQVLSALRSLAGPQHPSSGPRPWQPSSTRLRKSADYIRTHDPGRSPTRLKVMAALRAGRDTVSPVAVSRGTCHTRVSGGMYLLFWIRKATL